MHSGSSILNSLQEFAINNPDLIKSSINALSNISHAKNNIQKQLIHHKN